MEQILSYLLISLQHIAIIALFVEIFYVSILKPSRFQIELILLMISTLIMLVGYSVELYAVTPDSALVGTAVSYIGKPFALLMSLIFIADVCGHPLSKKIIAAFVPICLFFSIIVVTNGTTGSGHHLYYSTVGFNRDNVFSPLILGHGPLYWFYVVFLVCMFAAILLYIFRAFKNAKTRSSRRQLNLLFAMMASSIIGYLIFIFGLTGGYDTTMTGAAISTFLLTVVFFRYKLYDSLTLAKDHALQNASTGLWVLNDRNITVYTNDMIDRLLQTCFSEEELLSLPDGKTITEKEESVFEITKTQIEKNGISYGQTIELNDITDQYRYNIRLEHDIEERTKEIVNIQRSAITSFAGIVEARDSSTGSHIKRISRIVGLIAESLKDSGLYPDLLDDSGITRLMDVAPLHDIGKIAIPDAILMKPGKLTDEEFSTIKEHSVKGEQILRECLDGVEKKDYVDLACCVARYHHEKWNGTGYPDGLSGTSIPLAARIVAVADVYDAVRSKRCYKDALTKEEACQVILDGRGTLFDPSVVDAFLSALPKIELQ